MKMLFKTIDKLLANPNKLNITILDKMLRFGIPFNAPHGFKIQSISDELVKISLPNKRINHNHLGGVHACAMATVGEFCAGMALLRKFGISRYRLILSELHVNYTYQGRVELEGVCSPEEINTDEVQKSLNSEGKYLQKLTTVIQDLKGQEVAVVTTTWQLKSWDKVKTKS